MVAPIFRHMKTSLLAALTIFRARCHDTRPADVAAAIIFFCALRAAARERRLMPPLSIPYNVENIDTHIQ